MEIKLPATKKWLNLVLAKGKALLVTAQEQ